MNMSKDEYNPHELSLDAILDVLSHHHRRTLFRWLWDQPDQRANAQTVIDQIGEQEWRSDVVSVEPTVSRPQPRLPRSALEIRGLYLHLYQ